MKRIAVFPGSFDPITRGHVNIIERAAGLFDEIIVAIGQNTSKQNMFPLEKREAWVKLSLQHLPHIHVKIYDGLTIEFCKKNGAHYLLRGLRSGGDFEYERMIAQMNKALWHELETILIFTDPTYAALHSQIIREIIKNNGDVSLFVPPPIADRLH